MARPATIVFTRSRVQLEVPVAWTPETWHYGLRGARHPEEAFLLFPTHLFPAKPAMTMVGMTVPLDFIFIGKNTAGRYDIDHIRRDVRPGVNFVEPPRWVPWVLEVPAGWTKSFDVRTGDRVLVSASR